MRFPLALSARIAKHIISNQMKRVEKFALVLQTARERKLAMRPAAMLLAVRYVAAALQARGGLP